ncbi:MAG TPA: NADH-quinone oxidoreductase subunit NuoF [Actinomycetota bacterium]|nr:NADH-quinone oxidoreductase subunit NuoF [Actinomycetota bacterium]
MTDRMIDPVVTKRWKAHPEDSFTIERAVADGAYETLRLALSTETPQSLVDKVKASGLRGRGGAGFPTGTKWSFLAKDVYPRYLVVNDDEAEPGTFKDREITERDPHGLLEGALISAYATQASRVYIYCRGEFSLGYRRLQQAIEDARARGFIGEHIFGSDFSCQVEVHRGAGAYICGEETSLLDSLEGYRGQPRLRPPFPAVKGLYGAPTVVNNVETMATVPHIVRHGVDWFRSMGTEQSPGMKMFSVSGHVARPGNYEVALGLTLGELIDVAGGMAAGSTFKAAIPGGSSAPWVTDLNIQMSFEALAAAGTMLGSGAVVVFDQTTCAVRMATINTRFFNIESCGKCTPCREGTWWMRKVLERLEGGEGRQEDADLLFQLCEDMLPEAGAPASGRSFCALGDSAAWSLRSILKLFPEEFQAHVDEGACPLPQRRLFPAHASAGHGSAA